jgi:hypothetical protein
MQINPDRLIADMRALAAIGQYKTGVDRPVCVPKTQTRT